MKKFKVQGELIQITDIKENDIVEVDRGRRNLEYYLTLTAKGEYSLLAFGYEDNVRRTTSYKSKLYWMTQKMYNLYNEQLIRYTTPHLQCDKLPTRESVERKIRDIQRKEYVPVQFDKPQPTVAECQSILEAEAKQLYNSWWKRNKPLRTQYVKENLDKLFAQKVDEWNNLFSLHNSIEEKNAKEQNEKFLSEYEAAILPDEQILNGPTDYVYQQLEKIFYEKEERVYVISVSPLCSIQFKQFCVPFNANVDYTEKDGYFMVKIILPETFEKPNYNVSIDAKGKLKLQPKTQQEKDADFTQFLASLPFHIAYLMFSTTVNARTVDVSIVTHDEKAGYLYVRFDRERFTSYNFKELYPIKEIVCNLPSVIKLNDRMIIETMPINDLTQKTETLESNNSREYEAVFDNVWNFAQQQKYLSQIAEHEINSNNWDTSEGLGYNNATEGNIYDSDVDLSKRDSMFEEAARIIVINQQGSTSLIQRKFSIGYNRAGRIMGQLEAAGIVGPYMGSKTRDVLIPDEVSLDRLLETLR